MENYAAIMTTRGLAMIMESIRDGTPIKLKHLAVGDSDHAPEKSQTALVNERCRFELLRQGYDDDNPLWLRLSAVIPPDIGGWRIYEVGVFTEANELFAVANAGGDYKPVYKNGLVKEVELELIVEVSEQADFVLAVDPHKVIATRQWVEDRFGRALDEADARAARLATRLAENDLRRTASEIRAMNKPELFNAAMTACRITRQDLRLAAISIRGGYQ